MSGQQAENPVDKGENGTRRPGESAPEHAVAGRAGDALVGRCLALVRFLRRHCPWDASRTAETLRPYLLEEAHEVADCILEGTEEELASELGDLLLNVAFQIVVAEERGAFDARTVVERLESKMRKRHPHVYGDAAEAPDWEKMKARERREGTDAPGPASDGPGGVAPSLEALARAYRMQQRAAAMGFDWRQPADALDKVGEELAELGELLPGEDVPGAASADPSGPGPRVQEEVGDLLFAAVNVARMAGVHPSTALADANRKFEDRFSRLLERARREEVDLEEAPPASLEALWKAARREAGASPERTEQEHEAEEREEGAEKEEEAAEEDAEAPEEPDEEEGDASTG